MKTLIALLFASSLTYGQGYRTAGLITSGTAHGAFFTLHHQATNLWSVGLSAEAMKGKTLTAALLMVNHFTTGKVLFNFSIGHTVLPSHGAYLEGGAGVYLGRLVLSANYRHCAAMPRTEDRGRIMDSGVYGRVGIEF